MPPLYRIAEIGLYSLLNFLPMLALALYPFRRKLRFSVPVTVLLVVLLSVLQILLGIWAAFFSGGRANIVSAVSTVLYAAFYFLAVRVSFGKTFFTLLMLSNTANFIVICSKCIEGQLFPALAQQSYRWSFSLTMAVVEAIVFLPMLLYVKRVYTPAVEQERSGPEWRYLWLIPATFYLIWYYTIYGNTTLSSLAIALRPRNTVILFFINLGAILIYYIVTRLLQEQRQNLELSEQNHRLEMQSLQYENLQTRIADARRAKHDVRHHIALMQSYLKKRDYDALGRYLEQYSRSLPDDELVSFCENSAVNPVLLYFAQQARRQGVGFDAQVSLPEKIPIDQTDLSVLFGNLLENALEACLREAGDGKRIVVRCRSDAYALLLTVDNSFTGRFRDERRGAVRSRKHAGHGLGLLSVRTIAEKYHGLCRFESDGQMFYASVMLDKAE